MINRRLIMKLLLTAIVLLFCISGCAAPTRYSMAPEPPVTLPFAVHKAGATVSTDLRITKNLPNGGPYAYISTLHFKFKKNDGIDQERVRRLIWKRHEFGKTLYPTVESIPLIFKVSAIDPSGGETIISEKNIYLGDESGHGGTYFSRYVGKSIRLYAGLYRVTIQSLRDIPELAETFVTFGIYYPHGK